MARHVYTIIMIGDESKIKKVLDPHFKWLDDGLFRVNGDLDDAFVKLKRIGRVKSFHDRQAFDAVMKLTNTNQIRVIF